MTQTPDVRHRRNPLAWAVFLATSWTWCIGMFLPVLLIHDFGFSGWVVFAVPNVVGAAAMGWIIRTQEQSRQFVRKHHLACIAFSLVTILFHFYFIAWVLARLIGMVAIFITIPCAGVAWFLFTNDRRSVRTAIVIYVLSLLAFAIIVALIGVPTWDLQQIQSPFGYSGVAWIFPVCCLGFLTCPYLDLTFHRARQFCSRDGAKVAFGVGFGVFFLLMILFTLWYAGRIYQSVFSGAIPDLFIWLVAIHMMLQSIFTIAIHARAVRSSTSFSSHHALFILLIFIAVAVLIGVVFRHPTFDGTTGYLLFMSFYALAAPAYLCTAAGITKWNPILFIVAIIFAAPFYWLGFIDSQTIYLVPGVAIVLIAGAIARYSGSNAASANAASLPARQELTL